MAFTLTGAPTKTLWAPVEGVVVLYFGQLVEFTTDGLEVIDVPSGAYDTTGNTNIQGLVIGTNNKTKTYSATYGGIEYITGVSTQAAQNARDWFGSEGGVYPKGDPQALVQIARLSPNTELRAPLCNAALGAAPTLLTETTGNAAGTTITTNATQLAVPISGLCTIYCRTGANAGLYRLTTDASTTAATVTCAFPRAIAVGDTFVRVPLRPVGESNVYIDSLSMYIDVSATPGTNYYGIYVNELNLKRAGEEYARFTFNPKHFMGIAVD